MSEEKIYDNHILGKFDVWVSNNSLRILYWCCTLLIALIAFELLAITAAMPQIVKILKGPEYYSISFGVALAGQVITTVLSGIWCDKKGPRPSILLGVTIFIVGLVVSGLAPNMIVITLGRAIQGLGGGICVVPLYVIIGESVPANLQPTFFATFATAWVIPSIIGPVIAGFLVDHGYWRVIFLLVPVILGSSLFLVVPLILRLPIRTGPDPNASHGMSRPISWLVIAALVVGTGIGFLYLANSVSYLAYLLGPMLYVLMGLVVILIVLCLSILLPPKSLKIGRGIPSTISTRLFINGAFIASEIYLTIFLKIQDWKSTYIGILITISSLTWAIGSVTQGRIGHKKIWNQVPFIGCVIATVGAVITALSTTPILPDWVIYLTWSLVGLGAGAAFPALTVRALSIADAGKSGQVSSAVQLADTLGAAIGVAITGGFASIFKGYWSITVPLIATATMLTVATLLSLRVSEPHEPHK